MANVAKKPANPNATPPEPPWPLEPPDAPDPPLPLEFAAVSAGRYRAVSPVPPGEWVVRVGIEHGGERLAWHAPVATVTP